MLNIKYRIETEHHNPITEDRLNMLADEGWRLVTSHAHAMRFSNSPAPPVNVFTYFFEGVKS